MEKINDLKKRNEKIYNQWIEYYGDYAEIEFDSLISYRIMLYYQHVDKDTGEYITGEIESTLNNYLMYEIEYQLDEDKNNGYMERGKKSTR